MDQSKKTMRHFYCRDVLWETFEQMANDFDCSIDYLINEAMRYYARSKNYQSAQGTGGMPIAPSPVPTNPNAAAAAAPPPVPPAARRTAAPPPPPPGPGRMPPPPPSGGSPSTPAQGVPTRRPPPPPAAAAPAPEAGAGPTLYVIFNNQKIAIDKDQFIIGRGSKTSDLPIKDGNISRKHAAVIRRSGTFYIKDLGSTNGIDYKGMRIDNKRIDEGDIFLLCDHEIRFTYRP